MFGPAHSLADVVRSSSWGLASLSEADVDILPLAATDVIQHHAVANPDPNFWSLLDAAFFVYDHGAFKTFKAEHEASRGMAYNHVLIFLPGTNWGAVAGGGGITLYRGGVTY